MVVIILPLDEVARENFGPRFMTEIGESAPRCLQEFPYRLSDVDSGTMRIRVSAFSKVDLQSYEKLSS